MSKLLKSEALDLPETKNQ